MTLATAIGYQAMGPIAAMDYGNGVVLANTFDLDGRLTSIDSQIGGFGIVVRDYAFDLAGNITGVTDNAGTMSWDYTYDALYRLTFGGHDVLGGITDEESYSYDAAGNRTERIVTQNRLAVTDTLSYGAFSNRLETVSVFTPRAGPNPPSTVVRTLGYSGSGATATDDKDDSSRARVLDYDSTDRLVSVADTGGVFAAYLHNAQGQRVSKTVGGVTTHYVYGLGGNLIAEANGATGATQAEYVWLGGMPLAFVTGGAVYHVHPDHLGSPAKLTDAAGAVAWTGNSRPFGEPDTGTGGSVTFNLRFPGQYLDAETALHYNMNRDYEPGLGRYLESDPIGLYNGWNTYAYVGGNPIMYVDPEGLARGDGPGGKNKKFQTPANPNKPKGADTRQKSGARERKVGHPDAEEHSKKPKGKGRFLRRLLRKCFPLLYIDPRVLCEFNPEACYPDVFGPPEPQV